MFKYKDIACPYCGQVFKETDDILICPDCGAPYHRHCIQELGHCQFQELHEKGEAWQPPRQKTQEEEESKYDSHISRRCSRCGTINSPDKLFCEVCGNPLNQPESGNDDPPEEKPQNGPNPNQQQEQQTGFHQINYNPYTTPFGGLGPDEEIDGVPVKDLAIHVGQNSHYFLPRFKEMSTRNKKMNWNWSAFFLDCFYLLYRKMWGPAIVVAIVSALLSLPNLLIMYASVCMELNMELPFTESALNVLITMNSVFYFLTLGLKFAVGAFANYAYKCRVFRVVRKIQDESGESPEYSTTLAKKGGVSVKIIIIFMLLNLLFSMLSSILMVHFLR